MARHSDFNTIESGPYQDLMDPSHAFINWLIAPDADSFASTYLGYEIYKERADYPTCLLDYLFMWIAEDSGTDYCPTYESWLILIITIGDQLQRGTFGARWTKPWTDGPIDPNQDPKYYRHPEDFDLDDIHVGEDGPSIEGISLLPAPVDTQHPALDRVLFDRCVARRQQELLRECAKK